MQIIGKYRYNGRCEVKCICCDSIVLIEITMIGLCSIDSGFRIPNHCIITMYALYLLHERWKWISNGILLR